MGGSIHIENVSALDDALEHLRERPDIVGDRFEILRSPLPLPGGEAIPMFALTGGGIVTVVDAVVSMDAGEAGRIARSISWLRREGEWLAGLFPDRALRKIDNPRLLIVAPRFDERFAQTLHGLALSRITWLRICLARTAEGRETVLIERENEWNHNGERAVSPDELDELDEREAAFFRDLEGELSAVRNQGGVR